MSAATAVELPIITEQVTYARVKFTTKDVEGNEKTEYKIMSEEDAKSAVEKPADNTKVEIEVEQTFGIDQANSWDAARDLFTVNGEFAEKEACKQLNNSVKIKLQNRVRSLMNATGEDGSFTFEPQEGVYSLRQYIPEETAARGKTTFNKALDLLGKLKESNPEQLAQLLALMGQQGQ